MGFLEEIERSRQQKIQQELTRKAKAERQKQLAIQNAADEKKRAEINAERIERDAIAYVQDRSTTAKLLDRLNGLGYKGYFEEVSKISGFELEWVLYTRHPYYEPSANPAVLKQQLDVHKEFEDTSAKLNWPNLVKGGRRHSGHAFFNDKVTTIEEKKLTESEEVGIGVRFLKKAVKTDQHRNRLAEFFRIEYEFPIETWDHVAYVRMDFQSKATITGSNQRQVDLKDIKLLDEALGQAIHNPAIIHTTRIERWVPPPLSRPSGSGGASSSDTHGDMN